MLDQGFVSQFWQLRMSPWFVKLPWKFLVSIFMLIHTAEMSCASGRSLLYTPSVYPQQTQSSSYMIRYMHKPNSQQPMFFVFCMVHERLERNMTTTEWVFWGPLKSSMLLAGARPDFCRKVFDVCLLTGWGRCLLSIVCFALTQTSHLYRSIGRLNFLLHAFASTAR